MRTIEIKFPSLELTVIVEVDPKFGDASDIVARLKNDGLDAKRFGAKIIINGDGPLPKDLYG